MFFYFVFFVLFGIVVIIICVFVDVVKSRIMNMKVGVGGYGFVGLLLESLKYEGLRFLFKGWFFVWSEFFFFLEKI